MSDSFEGLSKDLFRLYFEAAHLERFNELQKEMGRTYEELQRRFPDLLPTHSPTLLKIASIIPSRFFGRIPFCL